LHCLPAERLIAYVPNQVKAPLAGSFDLIFGLARIAMLAQIDNDYIRPFLGEGDRDRTPYTTITPGDKCDLTLQFAATPVAVLARCGSRLHLGLDPGLGILVLGREMLLPIWHYVLLIC
jgi:hypothetical protein